MLFVGVHTTDTHKGPFLSGLVPVLDPGTGADAGRVLPVNLALFIGVLSALLLANDPLVVTVPAVEGLVLGGKSRVPGRGANVFDLVQEVLLLLVEIGDFVAENLQRPKALLLLLLYKNTESRLNTNGTRSNEWKTAVRIFERLLFIRIDRYCIVSGTE